MSGAGAGSLPIDIPKSNIIPFEDAKNRPYNNSYQCRNLNCLSAPVLE